MDDNDARLLKNINNALKMIQSSPLMTPLLVARVNVTTGLTVCLAELDHKANINFFK